MGNKRNPVKNKRLILLVLLGLLIPGGVIANRYRLSKNEQDQRSNVVASSGEERDIYTPATDDEKKEVEETKTGQDKELPQSDKPTPTPSNTDTPITPVSLMKAEEDSASNSVVVQVQLTGDGWKSCMLKMELAGQQVIKSSETIYQQNFSTCLGFSVPISELTPGVWDILLTAQKTDGSTYTASKKITVGQ